MIEQFFDSPRKRSIATTLSILLFTVLYLVTLGERPLFIPDEARYGEIAREMLATGDWIVPRLNGFLYFEKPPLGYWLNTVSLWLFGETSFAVRFSSALSTGISALTVFAIGRLFFTSRSLPYLATFVFITTLEVQAVGTFSVLDPIFAAALNGGILTMALSTYYSGRRRLWLLVVAGTLLGLAFLTKGFLAFALPMLVLTPWLLMRKEYKFLIRYAWITVITALLVIAPWALAIHSAEPDFWRYFFWVEHIQRFAADNAQHKEPFYFYLMCLPALAFPWIFLLPAILKGLREKQTQAGLDGVMLLLVLWATVPILFFSISSGKLPTYILPCFVPFAVIVAVGLSTVPKSLRTTRISLSFAVAAIVAVFLALIVFVANDNEVIFAPDERLKQVALYGSLLFAIVMLLFATLTRHDHRRLAYVGLSIVPFVITLPFSLPETTLERKAPQAFITQAYSQSPKDTVIVANGFLVPAVSWSARRSDVFVIENGGETTYGLESEDGRGRFLSANALEQLIVENGPVLVFCKGPCSAATLSALPPSTVNMNYGNFFAHLVRSASVSGDNPAPTVDRL